MTKFSPGKNFWLYGNCITSSSLWWEFPYLHVVHLVGTLSGKPSFRPQQEIDAKLGDGQTVHSGPSFTRLWYYNNDN